MTRRRVIIQPDAEFEIDQIARYLSHDSLSVALRFYDAVDETCKLLAWMPGIGKRRIAKDPALRYLRSWSVKGFRKYLIFYIPGKRQIEIVHVIHGSRDLPGAIGVE